MTPENVDKLKAINPKLWSIAWPCCGDGWLSVLEALSRKLAEIGPDVVASQVKEKFGTLRFYVGGATMDAHEAIHAAERRTETICETCGEPGKLRTASYWIYTACDACEAKRNER